MYLIKTVSVQYLNGMKSDKAHPQSVYFRFFISNVYTYINLINSEIEELINIRIKIVR
jgi:hypothetical protein